MKKIVLFVFILLNGTSVFAQNADSATNKPGKARNINGVLMKPSNTILINISSSPNFSTLVTVLKAAGLPADEPVTLFAPTNKAFEKFPPGQLDTLLLAAHKAELTNLLSYHMVAGRITSKDIQRQIIAGNGQAKLTTLSGGVLTARVNENRNIVLTDENGGQSVISTFDIAQSNGMVDIVTAVLIPHAK
jgi:uncharacterized surface protein with fasciclin (FAS1) repeats